MSVTGSRERVDLTPYLDDLAARIDPREEARIHEAWMGFLDGRPGYRNAAGAFVPPSRAQRPAAVEWPDIHINDALDDPDTMVLHQLSMVSAALEAGSNAILNVRANYGVSIMTSQLGCEVVVMSREQGNLPTTRPLTGPDPIRAALDRGVPDVRAGQGGDVFDCGERMAQALRRHDVIDRWVMLYHPDAQGPIDNAELAWGSAIFLAFYDEPQLVHDFLDLMTEHYLTFLRAWFAAHPPRSEYSAHWGHLIKGRIMLRDDSLMNLSPQIYDEFIHSRERRCFAELGGGAIHYCGRGSHVIDRFPAIDGLTAVNLSQPHLNEMDRVFAHTVDRGIRLIGLEPSAAAEAAAGGTELHGGVHCHA
jgi:hypothetical protein